MRTTRTCYETRAECVKFCRDEYRRLVKHELIFCRERGNAYYFKLLCKGCKVPIVSAECSRSTTSVETFSVTDYGVKEIHPVPDSNQFCFPTIINGAKKSTIDELAESVVLNVVNNDMSRTKGKTRGISTVAKQALLVSEGRGVATLSSIKTAQASLKIKPGEHIQSYNVIFAYFEQWQLENPKLAYEIDTDEGGHFRRLAVVMPYTEEFLPNMLNVYGLDAGFMPEVPLRGNVL
jgi:hypothetical protein